MGEEAEFKQCFGTFDDSNPAKSCRDCSNSGQCESYKPILEKHKTSAAEQAVDAYIHEETEHRHQQNSKVVGYTITLGILALVFWQVMKEL
ncbi:MAG TPA: hypothetical protein ENJ33_01930 [Thiothrix sp.]|nr:hypothetical protein [Thiothrix sp.]